MQQNPVDVFLNEAEDLLAEIESTALSLGDGPADPEKINLLFRAFHTVKGSGAMFGFDGVAAFTHHVESLLSELREGAVEFRPGMSRLLLEAGDHIRALLAETKGGGAVPEEGGDALIARLAEYARSAQPATPVAAPETELPTWRITFRPNPGLMACGGNPILIFRDLRKLGKCDVKLHADQVPPLDEMQADTCYMWWTATLRTKADRDAIRDVFLFVEEGSELQIELAGPATAEIEQVAADQPVAASSSAAEKGRPRIDNRAKLKESSVRVPSERLDRLVNLVGELVMNQSRLAQAASTIESATLAGPVEEIERLVAELRDDVLEIRMMPIGTIFGRFRRLVHDLSIELGKQIDLVTEGAETELDKSVLDQLGEPLVHLLRNSIDHGIEAAADREAAGKPGRGTIRLVASHKGADVVITIEDDGRGLDRTAIRAKAVDRQIIAPDAVLSDKEILNLILLPGFSTAKEVTSVSGRGVGMDVVKRQIESLRGSLSVASDPGRGTCVSLTLPLTLAIIDGLLVEAGGEQFIIPMAAVMENVELHQDERRRNNGRNVIAVRGELVPYVDLRETFGISGAVPAISKIVIVRHEGDRAGLVVDRVLGTHQTVIQSLGRFFRKVQVVSGSTVMGDGRVALILDISGVVRYADRRASECRLAGGPSPAQNVAA